MSKSGVIKTKKELGEYLAALPAVIDCKTSYEEDQPEPFDEVMDELVKLAAVGEGSPDFGEDWSAWISEHIEELLQEAIDIVM